MATVTTGVAARISSFPLEPLDLDDIEGISDWHERFEQYCLTETSAITDKNKTSYYLAYIGKQAYRRLKDLAFPDKPSTKKVEDLQKLLESHLCPVNYEAAEREKFHNLRRKSEESFRSFLLRIQQQAAKCDFGSALEEQMRDRIIAGVADQEVKRKLLKEKALTFKAAKKIIEEWNDVNSALHHTEEILHVRNNRSDRQRQTLKHTTGQPIDRSKDRRNGACDSCGGAHSRQSCKFRQAECFKYRRKGHIKRVCRALRKDIQTVQTHTEDESDPDITVFTLEQAAQHLHQDLLFDTGRRKPFILDTGSPVTFLPKQEFQALGFKDTCIRPSTTTIRGVSGHSLQVLGQFRTRVRTEDGNGAWLTILITSGGPTVLGLDGLKALNIKFAFSAEKQSLPDDIKQLIAQCSQNEDGMRVQPIHLEFAGEPVFLKARPLPFELRAAVKAKVDEMVKDGVLQPVAASRWATPIVTVQKPDGQPRECGDYRITVNPLLMKTATTTLDVEAMFEGLHGSTHFSKVDLSNAFHQVPLDDSSSELTTINTMWGLYRYRFLPFGLSVSPASFKPLSNASSRALPVYGPTRTISWWSDPRRKNTTGTSVTFYELFSSTTLRSTAGNLRSGSTS